MISLDNKRWLPKLLSKGVHRSEHSGMPDDTCLKPLLSREIDEREPNEDCQDTLSRKNQHGNAGEQEHDPRNVLKRAADDAKRRMMALHPRARDSDVEIVFRQTNQHERDDNKCSDKRDCRDDGHFNEQPGWQALKQVCQVFLHACVRC